MPTSLRLGSFAFVALVMSAAPARAQQEAPKPIRVFRGLFGPTESEQKLHQRLFVTISAYGAADDSSPFSSGADIADTPLQVGRFYQGAQAQLSFKRQRARSILTVDGLSGLRYYSGLHGITTSQHGGTLNGDFVPAPRWRVQINGSGSYTPNFQLQLGQPQADGPAAPGGAGEDFSVSRQKAIAYGVGTTVTWLPNRASEVLLSAGGRYSQILGAPDFSARSARARYTRRISRDFALRLGYGDGLEGRSDGEASRVQNIDAGVSYSRGIVFSPKASIGFSSGSAIVSTADGRHFQMVGATFLKYQLSARWTAQAGVDRSVQSIPTAPRPFVTDAANASLSGYLTRRTSLRIQPTFAKGVDVQFKLARYHSYSNQSRLEFALSRFWAVYVEHFYYRYEFSAAADLSSGLPRLTRQGARMGLTLWAPMVR